MPEKTHLGGGGNRIGSFGGALLFELGWCAVAEGRVQPLVIVVAVQELFDMLAEIVDIAVIAAVNLFVFESLHETLTGGVGTGIQMRRMVTLGIDVSG